MLTNWNILAIFEIESWVVWLRLVERGNIKMRTAASFKMINNCSSLTKKYKKLTQSCNLTSSYLLLNPSVLQNHWAQKATNKAPFKIRVVKQLPQATIANLKCQTAINPTTIGKSMQSSKVHSNTIRRIKDRERKQ